MATEGIEVRSVGNTLTLHSTALIEAFNLKAAIEYHLGNCKKYTKVQTLSLKENLKKKKPFVAYLQLTDRVTIK